MVKNYKIKLSLVAFIVAFLITIKLISRNWLITFEKKYEDKDIVFFEKRIDELKHASKDEIIDFNLKMSVATNTLFLDYDFAKKIKTKKTDINVLRQNSISFWKKEIINGDFFNKELKNKQEYFKYNPNCIKFP